MWVPFKEKTSYGTSGFPGCLHTSLHLFARAREIGRYNHHRSFFQERSGRISMHITLSGLLFLIYQSMLWSFILITVIEAWQRYLGGALKQKYVLRYRKGKMQRALPNSSFPPIHLFIWIFQVLRLRTRRTYFNRFPTSFFFFSSSLNHSLSMHSVHFLPNLELERSRIVEVWGALIATLHGGTYIHIFPVLDWDPKQ